MEESVPQLSAMSFSGPSLPWWPAHSSAPWSLPSSIHLCHRQSKFTTKIWKKSMVHNPDPLYHPPSQPHIMMVACPPHCPTPLLTPTLPSHPRLPNAKLREMRQFWNVEWKNGRLCNLRTNWMQNKWWRRLIRSAGRNQRKHIWRNSQTLFIWFGWWWTRRCLSRWKDKTEMECQAVVAWTRDGYVASFSISLSSTAPVLHQDLCSKELELDKEEKGGEIHKLQCGKCWKVNWSGGLGWVCKAVQWHQALFHQCSQLGQHGLGLGRQQQKNKINIETANNNKKASLGGGGFYMLSPDNNCKGGINFVIGGGFLIDSWLSSQAVNEDCTKNNSTPGIQLKRRLRMYVWGPPEKKSFYQENYPSQQGWHQILLRSKELARVGLTSIWRGSTWQLHLYSNKKHNAYMELQKQYPGLVWSDSILNSDFWGD